MTVHTWQDLVARGISQNEIRRVIRDGGLIKLRRDSYTFLAPSNASERHLLTALAFPDRTLGLETAALVHGLPVQSVPTEVELVCPGDGTSWRMGGATMRSAPLTAGECIRIGPYAATTIARTVVDLARVRGIPAGLITWEAARWEARASDNLAGLDAAIDLVLGGLARRRGIPAARFVRTFASALSQSPMESLSRWRIHELGWPAPVQQFEIVDEFGQLLGAADFAWPEAGVVGEYDGEGKYTELARPGEQPLDVLRREKRRQESIEAAGWTFARWGKSHLRSPQSLDWVLRQAFARARRGSAASPQLQLLSSLTTDMAAVGE